MKKLLLVIFIGMVLAISLYGLTVEHTETNDVSEAVTVIYVE